VLTPADLKARLSIFYKNLPAREYKFLISEPEFTYKTLYDDPQCHFRRTNDFAFRSQYSAASRYRLLVNNELTDYDPVAEAFKAHPSPRPSACAAHARA
jgi:hypothetical protein